MHGLLGRLMMWQLVILVYSLRGTTHPNFNSTGVWFHHDHWSVTEHFMSLRCGLCFHMWLQEGYINQSPPFFLFTKLPAHKSRSSKQHCLLFSFTYLPAHKSRSSKQHCLLFSFKHLPTHKSRSSKQHCLLFSFTYLPAHKSRSSKQHCLLFSFKHLPTHKSRSSKQHSLLFSCTFQYSRTSKWHWANDCIYCKHPPTLSVTTSGNLS